MLTVFFTVSGEFFTKAAAAVQEPLSPMLLPKGLRSKITVDFTAKNMFGARVRTGGMYRFRVNLKLAPIFNRGLKWRNPARNWQKTAHK
jgi:hypothetical protein